VTKVDRLKAFLEATGAHPVIWGVDDCSAAPVAWMAQETGKRIRLPTYSNRDEAQAVIASFGGLSSAWESIAREHGIPERYEANAQLGDVAVIQTRIYGEIGCIVAAGRIACCRLADGGWHMLGPVRQFEKVYAVDA